MTPQQHKAFTLTKRQQECLDSIKTYQRRNNGRAPSLQKLADMMGLRYRSEVHRLLVGLEERGHIERLK